MLDQKDGRLRVCIVITALGIGGAEHALLTLLSRIDRSKFDISMIVLGREDNLLPRFLDAGVQVNMLRMRPGRWPFGEIQRFLKVVREIAPDILQGWMYHGNLAASFAASRLPTKVPVCWSVRDTPDTAHNHSRFTRMVIGLSSWYAKRVARIFNVSSHSAAYCSQHLGWPADRTFVLPNGVDTDRFKPDESARAGLRSSVGIPLDAKVIGMVARWSPVKNHRLFLEAAAILRKTKPAVIFVLAGKGLETSNTELMSHIERLQLINSVRLLGPCEDTAKIYPAFDLLALTSKSEGFPNVLAEAMSCAVPVVSTDVGDARSIVGEFGRIVPATAEAFADALSSLLNDEKRTALGHLARGHIQSHYGVDAVVQQLETNYRMLVNR